MSQSGIYPSTNSSSNSNANSMSIAAENYQLKWNSHVTNLNSSICSLYKNDKYADCMLFTCNVDEGSFGFPAHKVILGTCSHYFASLFDNNPMPISGMIFIVLPPELNRRAMGILLQYMYMGEATVGNDILNEVLKGGEVLKIRGLCKVLSDTPTFVNSSKYETTTTAIPVAAASSNFNQVHYNSNQSTVARASPMRSNKSTPRNSIDRKTSSDMKHHINGSNSFDSTVSNPPSAVVNLSNNQPTTTIIVKKDVAIDPGDSGNIPVEHYGLISLKIAAAVKKAQQQNSHNISSMKKSSNATTSNIAPDPHHQNREFYSTIIADRESSSQQHFDSTPPLPFKVYTSSNDAVCNLQQQIQEDILRYTEKKKRIAENPASLKCDSRYAENGNQSQFHHTSDERERISSSSHSQHFPEALSFLTIKEEPLEWSELDASQIDSKGELVDIKPESIEVDPAPPDKSSTSFSPLTCELCNLKFQVPGAWVRHIESHSEVNNTSSSSSCSSGSGNSAQNVPKKRKRTTDEVSRYRHSIDKVNKCEMKSNSLSSCVFYLCTE